jgi:AcrR family transcriptional regulator
MTHDPQVLLSKLLSTVIAAPGATETRILDAALAEFTEFGLRRVTMEDVARRAGVHRVTIYRRFDNKSALVQAVILRELHIFLTSFGDVMRTVSGGIAELVAEGFVFTLQGIRTNRLVTRLLAIEPDTIVPYFTVEGGPFLTMASRYLAGLIRRTPGVPEWLFDRADEVAETQIRLMLTFAFIPDGAIALTDEKQMRRYAHRYLVPMLTGEHTA